jgi:hypothetical protein
MRINERLAAKGFMRANQWQIHDFWVCKTNRTLWITHDSGSIPKILVWSLSTHDNLLFTHPIPSVSWDLDSLSLSELIYHQNRSQIGKFLWYNSLSLCFESARTRLLWLSNREMFYWELIKK